MERELKVPKLIEAYWDSVYGEEIVCILWATKGMDHGLIPEPCNSWIAGICRDHMPPPNPPKILQICVKTYKLRG